MTESFSWFRNWIKNPKLVLISIAFMFSICGRTPKDDQPNTGIPVGTTYLKVNYNDTATFYWDAVYNYFDTVESYTLYYHTLSDTNWKILKSQIPQADSPRVVIKREEIPVNDSILFFGVTSMTLEGVESDLHSCTDSTANPPNWAIIWYRRQHEQ